MNHEIMTYEEWVKLMTPKVRYRGREWHNWGASYSEKDSHLTMNIYVEDWIAGERVWTKPNEEVTFNMSPDIRYIPLGNRNYSEEMWPEYIAIGADKWEYPSAQERGLINPPPPIKNESL
jgi:hypothetical protein